MDDLSPTEVESLSKLMGNMVLSEYKPKEPVSQSQEISQNPENFPFQKEKPIPVSKAEFLQIEEETSSPTTTLSSQDMENLYSVKLDIEVVLGSVKMPLKEVFKLQTGKVIALDKMAGEPVDLVANGKIVARGEIVVIEDHFGIRILDILEERS